MYTLWVSFIVLLMLTVWCAGEKSPLYGGTRSAEKFDDVDAIQVQTVEGLRPFHGRNTCKGCSPINPPHKLGGPRYQINLRYPDEYIYKISGHSGWYGLSQFYIYTRKGVHGNTTTYGPFGKIAGEKKFSSKEGKIVGFWGYASTSTSMRGIGVYFQDPPPATKSPLYGGNRSAEKFDDGPSSGILSLTIYSGAIVDAIQVRTVEGLRPFHGTNSCKGCSPINPPHKLGGTRYQINFRYPYEYIYKISGSAGCYGGWDGLSQFYIYTRNSVHGNTTTYGPFGNRAGGKENFRSKEGKIVGFWGYASTSTYMRGIGVYFQDPPPPATKSPLYGGTRSAEKFDDGPSSGILSLTIYSAAVVDAIQVQTVEGLRPFHGTKSCRGCSPINPPHKLGGTRYQINLRYPYEYIYKISGYAGWSSVAKVWGLSQFYIYTRNSIHGNTTTYGPFGNRAGGKENFYSKEGKIVGFWGYASTSTDVRGIGVYIQNPPPATKSPLYGGREWAMEFDDGPSSGILSLTIYSGAVVDAIQVQTVEGLRPFHGTNTCKGCSPIHPPHKLGGTRYKINLRYPDEYIYKISGYAGWSSLSNIWGLSQFYIYIKNSVHGKITTYGPFGYTPGKENFRSKEGKIVGFWGYASASTYMRGIGVYIQDPLPSPRPPSPPPTTCIPYQQACVCCNETPSAKCCPEGYECQTFKGEWKYLSNCQPKYALSL
ncbi:hypothetical protein SELMODRAFT_421303 [Selaginella moellendorffii]|uniref:Jacalin-type lectin domain-containing protein n=1 Tax=Selaginella moellendorffii TaxID=88036 RepID=D8SEU3_SELML|nr:hypothetical protein SELMODRAFT_421303 [Selaginella moellendorffii]